MENRPNNLHDYQGVVKDEALKVAGDLHNRINEAAALFDHNTGERTGWAPEDTIPILTRGLADFAVNWANKVCGNRRPASTPMPEPPIHVTACHRPEPSATAFLCFSEDELDEWWNGLDVAEKADAFAGFSLRAQGQDESFVHVPETRIPVEGAVVGDRAIHVHVTGHSAQACGDFLRNTLRAVREALNRAQAIDPACEVGAVSQPDGAGDAAVQS